MRSSLLARPSLILTAALALAIPSAANAEGEPLALSGFDVVAYFDASTQAPVEGDPMFTEVHEGSEYRFATSEHAMAFAMSPESYLPLFGGLDPVLLAQGKPDKCDGQWFTVIDGGLYCFHDASSRDAWLRSFDTLAPRALASWDAGASQSAMTTARVNASLTRNNDKHLLKDSLGAGGYDVVSYFPEGGGDPVKGSKQHELTFRGVTYRFASAEHLAEFRRRPSRYEPAYGGWCAYAIAHEDYTKPNPKRFLIQNDRLMLFYDGFLGDTYKSWHKEGPARLEGLADSWWTEESGETTGGSR